MADKLDFKKLYKDLYQPGKMPALVQVPPMPFIYVDGSGAPEGAEYQNAVPVLYALSWTIKMSKMGGQAPRGYVEYVVPPLEGLWWGEVVGRPGPRDAWRWTSLIRQPDFVTREVFDWAVAQAAVKKPELDLSLARYGTWEEGLCVQAMHTGPFATEPETVARLHAFMEENGLVEDADAFGPGPGRRHHEIYMGDPRKTAPEKQKTVLRLPVKRL